MPIGSRYVGRPTKWGNPWAIEADGAVTRDESVALYRRALIAGVLATGVTVKDARRELRGLDLVCWCPLDQACHADVLLDVANSTHLIDRDGQS